MATTSRALALAALISSAGAAQEAVTRDDVIAAALSRGLRAALARSDSATAAGELRTARAYPNPTFTATYTKDVPQYHAVADFPIDLAHQAKGASARAALDAATARYTFERAAVRFEADTLYTRALDVASHARLSRHTARDADSLRTLAIVRRDAGDASELDVQLATVNAGQAENAAASDSLAAEGAVLDVQRVMGRPSSAPTVSLADTLTLFDTTAIGVSQPSATPATPAPPPAAPGPARTPPPATVAAAEAALQSADRAVSAAHASAFGTPAILLGVDWHDPTPNGARGALPLVGAAVPVPLFNRGRGSVQVAIAARDRARTELEIARRESEAAIAQVTRQRDVAFTRVARDRTLLNAADRVATMSLTAFAEGAVALPNVLAAQRTARESRAQYVDDVAAADNAVTELQLLTTAGRRP
jgi:cobalt-zinc-cadmium efflux system outer membrane protein